MGYARRDVEKTKKIAKKFVRYQECLQILFKYLTVYKSNLVNLIWKIKPVAQ